MNVRDDSLRPLSDSGDDAETWNLTRFDPNTVDRKKGHVESYFVKLNDPAAPRALWVKVTVFSPTEKTSGGPLYPRGSTVVETWAIAFDHSNDESPTSYREGNEQRPSRARHVAAKQTIPYEEATLARVAPFRIQAAGVELESHATGQARKLRLRGEVRHGHARVRFDLELDPRDRAPFVPFPLPSMYRGSFPKSKLVSPIFDARANGEVVVEGNETTRSWEVRDWPAMQGHNWGAGHADLYAWAHCNAWNEPEGRDVVFEGFSGRVKAGLFTTPLVTIVGLRHRGVRYEARAVAELARARGTIEGHRRWTFAAKQAGAVLEGAFELREDDTVGLYYPNPTGIMTYCLNSKIAHASLKFTPEGRSPVALTSDAAALEIGTHDASHGIRMYV